MPTRTEVFDFITRFQAMYNSKQRMMLAEVDKIVEGLRENAGRKSHLSFDEWDAFWREHQPLAASWHGIWCIAAKASCVAPGDITPEVWEKAVAMLEKYEQGRIVNRELVVNMRS